MNVSDVNRPQIEALPGGGFIADAQRQQVNAIVAGYHTEHNDNDTHKAVTADTLRSRGPIYEKARAVGAGYCADLVLLSPFNASAFTGNGSMTWTVAAADVRLLRYTRVGNLITVIFNIAASTTVGGVLGTQLLIALPPGLTPKHASDQTIVVVQENQMRLTDAGTNVLGSVQVRTDLASLVFIRNDSGNLSAGNTGMRGSLTFEAEPD